MDAIKEIYHRTKVFLIPYLIILLIGGIVTAVFTKFQIHSTLNQLNCTLADFFFKYITFLGSGWFLVIIMIVVAIIEKDKAGGLLMSALIFNFLVQLLKHTVKAYRPAKYFALYFPDYPLHLVEGVKMHYLHSFPSGHTATAFAIFFFLAFLARKDWVKFVYFLLAVIIAYSRIYLSQHFLIDVLAGSVIGITSSYLGAWWTLVYEKTKLKHHGEPSIGGD